MNFIREFICPECGRLTNIVDGIRDSRNIYICKKCIVNLPKCYISTKHLYIKKNNIDIGEIRK